MKFPVIPVSSGLIIQNNKVLIGLRSENDNGGGLWEFPGGKIEIDESSDCLLYTSPSPRDATLSRMPSSA